MLARNGGIEICDLRTEDCAIRTELKDPTRPAFLQRGLLGSPVFLVHYNKLVEDRANGMLYATSLQSGRLYALAAETLEIRKSVFLERGVRWVNFDPVIDAYSSVVSSRHALRARRGLS